MSDRSPDTAAAHNLEHGSDVIKVTTPATAALSARSGVDALARRYARAGRSRCGSVGPSGCQCRGLDGHLDTAPLGRHYAYPTDTHETVEIEEWR